MKKLKIIYLALLLTWIFLPTAFAGTIQLPQTGQTKCYDSSGIEIPCEGTGQDGEYRAGVPWPEPRFSSGVAAEADCMIDNITGLMWSKNANLPNGVMTWNDAIDYANNLSLCGHSDWRLPNVNELNSIINANEPDSTTWLMAQGFINVRANTFYWSSTTASENTTGAQSVYMVNGVTVAQPKEGFNYYSVWPVRGDTRLPAKLWKTGQTASYRAGDDGDLQKGNAWPSPRFTANEECVTDNLTGLMWARNASLWGFTYWPQSLDRAESLTLCGYSDWRLPNRTELMSLIDWSQYGPPLPAGHPFVDVQAFSYGTSTTDAAYVGRAWVVPMMIPNLVSLPEAWDFWTWPVRGGVTPPLPPPGPADDITALVPYVLGEPNDPNDTRTTLILVHGIHGIKELYEDGILDEREAIEQLGGWDNFLNYYENIDPDLKNKYKVYRFLYLSDKQPVYEIGRSFKRHLEEAIARGDMNGQPVVLLAHSMGGLVSRSMMQEQDGDAQVKKLITLATPHHGTPGENDTGALLSTLSLKFSWYDIFVKIQFLYHLLNSPTEVILSSKAFNRSDLRWDNAYRPYVNSSDVNTWLKGLNEKLGDRPDIAQKIIAYYGYLDRPCSKDWDTLWEASILKTPYGTALLKGMNDNERLCVAGTVMGSAIRYMNVKGNDGMVPISSGRLTGYQVGKRVGCPDYDHKEMQRGEEDEPKRLSSGKTLFESLADDLMEISRTP